MKNEDILLIKKMIKYCDDIGTLMTRFDTDFERYKADISFQYSCNMCIIQLGELANRLSDEAKESSQNIPWRAIKGMRNLHAHDYENVDMEIVSLCREKSDYDDFFAAGHGEAEEQLKNAKYFVEKIEKYINLIKE